MQAILAISASDKGRLAFFCLPFYFFDAVDTGGEDVQAGCQPCTLVCKADGSKMIDGNEYHAYYYSGNHFQDTGEDSPAGKAQPLYAEAAGV